MITLPDSTTTISLAELAGLPPPGKSTWWRRALRRHDLRLLPAAGTVWLASLLGVDFGWVWAVVAGLVLAAVALVAVRRRTIRVAAWAVVICGVLVACLTGIRLHHQQTSRLISLAQRSEWVRLHVTLTDLPKPIRSIGFASRPGGVRSYLIPAETEGCPILLIVPTRGWATLIRGQQADASGELEPALDHQDVAVLRVRSAPGDVTPPSAPQRMAESLRAGLRAASAGLPDDDRGLLPAIVVGDRSGVDQLMLDDFQQSGMDYLMAVGGLHFMVVCGALLWLLFRIGVGPRLRALAGGVVLFGFAEVAGGEPNVLRAGLMVGVGLLALATGRARSGVSALAGSVVVLTLWQPDFATDLGFALSVLATAAMVLLATPTAQALQRAGVPAGVARLMAVALVAQLATAPVIAAAYGSVSVPSLLANMFVEPAFVPAMLIGAIVLVLAPMWPWAAAVLAHLTVPELAWLRIVAHRAARLPASAVAWPTGWWGGLALAAVLVGVVVALRYRRLRALMFAAVIGVIVIIVPVRVFAPGWPPAHWAMIDCDVGQGDGEVLSTDQPGRVVLVDTGPDPESMDECLDLLDVDSIDMVVLSHLHADHVGGLVSVLRDWPVAAVAVGPSRVPDWAWHDVVRETTAAHVPLVELSVGQRLRWPGLTLDVLGPTPADQWPVGDDPSGTVVNNSSLVVRATTDLGRILLTGDVEVAEQEELLESKVDLRAVVLKIPHHGSRYSSAAFLDAVHAKVAVASVGAGNPYGHPSPQTLGRLAADGALVLRTDHDGDVAIVPGPHGPAAVPRGDPRPPPNGRAHTTDPDG